MEERKETVVLCGANSYEQKFYFNKSYIIYAKHGLI